MSGSAGVGNQGSSCPTGGSVSVKGNRPVKLFAKLFGKSAREGSDNATARHRAQPDAEGQRPLFRDQVAGPGGDISGGQGAASVDPAQSGGIGFGQPSTSGTGGGFASGPYASNAPAGQPRQEDPSMSVLVCTRCGNRNAESARFCSNCGAPLRPGWRRSVPPRRLPRSRSPVWRRTTPRRPGRRRCRCSLRRRRPRWTCAAGGIGAAGGAARPELGQPLPAGQRPDHGRPSPAERHLPGRRDGLPGGTWSSGAPRTAPSRWPTWAA